MAPRKSLIPGPTQPKTPLKPFIKNAQNAMPRSLKSIKQKCQVWLQSGKWLQEQVVQLRKGQGPRREVQAAKGGLRTRKGMTRCANPMMDPVWGTCWLASCLLVAAGAGQPSKTTLLTVPPESGCIHSWGTRWEEADTLIGQEGDRHGQTEHPGITTSVHISVLTALAATHSFVIKSTMWLK